MTILLHTAASLEKPKQEVNMNYNQQWAYLSITFKLWTRIVPQFASQAVGCDLFREFLDTLFYLSFQPNQPQSMARRTFLLGPTNHPEQDHKDDKCRAQRESSGPGFVPDNVSAMGN